MNQIVLCAFSRYNKNKEIPYGGVYKAVDEKVCSFLSADQVISVENYQAACVHE